MSISAPIDEHTGQNHVAQSVQGDLFDSDDLPPPLSGLFADIVFDRPLDHAFTYAVPDSLREDLSAGKRVLVPFGKGDRPTTGFCVRVTEAPPSREVKAVLRVVDDAAQLDDNLMRLTRWMADYYLCGWGQVLNAVIPAGAKAQSGTRSAVFLELVPETELPGTLPSLTAKQTVVLEFLRTAGRPVEFRQLSRSAACGPGPINSLVNKGYIRRRTRRVDQFTDTTDEADAESGPLTLNADQLKAWAPVEQAIRAGDFHAFLLHGVTGSGKTEIYLRAIEEVIRQGKEAIVLVPEISLTPQTISRFRGRCGEVAVLHSHLGDAERGGHWRRIADGKVQVVVGARSAVFAPTRNLGLIVIDEEHEGTFKQENTPRYHARDVAVMRARLENIPILLGSATPSLESWHNAQRGQYTLLNLPSRILDRPLPHVALIDLRHESSGANRFHALSLPLERAMRDALRAGGQIILLLNRRGFSTHVHCPSCGHVESCRHCDLALTFHRQRDVMLCHYCGFEREPPALCPQCGKQQIRFHGLGTEKLEEEIAAKFHDYVARRMDSDTMRRPGSHSRVLSAFRQGLIHILLGTQMIAKGLDFPNVTLVGVVNADVGLHIPDFRSAERTFQLLSQVAGRAGRGPQGGRVLVQTFNPEQPCIALAATHDYEGFVQREMAVRQAHNYPPFQRMARLIIRGRDQAAAGDFAERMAGAFSTALSSLAHTGKELTDVGVLGPAECPVFRLKSFYRFHFQVQSPSPGSLHQLLRHVLPVVKPPTGVEFALDIDPQNML
jgi:primosomal protein N' (replication factor Y)